MVNPDQEVAKLLEIAKEMIEDVDRLLDDSSHDFPDGSGEGWCKNLREHAGKLDAAGYSSAARELSSRADDVEERTDDCGL